MQSLYLCIAKVGILIYNPNIKPGLPHKNLTIPSKSSGFDVRALGRRCGLSPFGGVCGVAEKALR